MTKLCKKSRKDIRGRCTLTVKLEEVLVSKKQGKFVYETVRDKAMPGETKGLPKRFQYTLKRIKLKEGEGDIKFGNKVVSFKYKPVIVESFGRVI